MSVQSEVIKRRKQRQSDGISGKELRNTAADMLMRSHAQQRGNKSVFGNMAVDNLDMDSEESQKAVHTPKRCKLNTKSNVATSQIFDTALHQDNSTSDIDSGTAKR